MQAISHGLPGIGIGRRQVQKRLHPALGQGWQRIEHGQGTAQHLRGVTRQVAQVHSLGNPAKLDAQAVARRLTLGGGRHA